MLCWFLIQNRTLPEMGNYIIRDISRISDHNLCYSLMTALSIALIDVFMKLLLVCIANEIPRNANVIHIISCDMVSPTVPLKIYKLISQNHEFYLTVIVFIFANDVKIEI